MEIILNDIKYVDQFTSNAKLIEIPLEGQTQEFVYQAIIDSQNYTLSTRNGANVYTIPTNQENVYVNFVPKKVLVTDTNLKSYINTNFEYFLAAEIIPPELFTLPDGQIFRCVSESSLPLPKEQYTYYLMVNGIAKEIPNYKTLEVILAERNQTLLSVRVITGDQCSEIPKPTPSPDNPAFPDKSSSWNSSMADQTTNEILNALNANVQSGAAIAEDATAAASTQIAAVQAQAAADQAAAQAAQAQATAATAASQAAQTQAQAAIAQANAAQAASEAATAAANNS